MIAMVGWPQKEGRLWHRQTSYNKLLKGCNWMWPDETVIHTLPFCRVQPPLHCIQVGRGLGRDMSRLTWWDPRSGITRSDKQSLTSACQFSCSASVLPSSPDLTGHGTLGRAWGGLGGGSGRGTFGLDLIPSAFSTSWGKAGKRGILSAN